MTLIATSFGSLWTRKKRDVPASSTIVMDRIPLARFEGVKYILTGKNDTQDVRVHMEVSAVKIQGGDVKFNKNNKLGDGVKLNPNVTISGTDVILELANGETFDVTVQQSKLITF